MNAVQKCIANVDGLVRRDQQAVKGLMEGLVLSGIAMQMMGNSRPASGAEHHISHYWEMQHFMKGQTSPFHGIKVGVATPLIISMYRKLFSMNKDELHIVERNAADRERWKAEIRRCYGPLADEVIMENEAGFLPSEKTREALNRLKEQWDKVKEETDFFLSAAGDIRKLMMKMEAPSSPEDLGIPPAMLYDALCHAMEVRSRYTILRLADRVGLLDQFAEEITHEMYHNG